MLTILELFLQAQKRRRIETAQMERHLIDTFGAEVYWQKGGYEAFARAIGDLEAEGLLRPVKASEWNGKNPPLYNMYQREVPKPVADPHLKEKLLTYYHPSLQTSYYLKQPGDFVEDERYINQIDRFFKEGQRDLFDVGVTVNERSFQLFQDEKWLASPHGKAVLARLGLTWEDLRCYPTYEPFFYYRRGAESGLPNKNALIVENKDTFFSLKALFQTGVYAWEGVSFDLLIYGEGHKIEHSFAFFWELEEYRDCTVSAGGFATLEARGHG